MKLLVLLSCVVAVAIAQKPKCKLAGCCTPKQWEGFEAPLGGFAGRRHSGLISGWSAVHYDAVNERVASFSNMTIGRRQIVIKVVLKEGNAFIVDERRRKCFKKEAEFKKSCVPKDAVCGGAYWYGAGSNTFNAEVFTVKVQSKRSRIDIVASIAKGCIPVGEAVIGSHMGVKFEETVGFVDIKTGIKDPAVFDLPDFCKDAESEHFEFMSSKYELKKYKILGF